MPQRKETSFSLPSTATTSEKEHPLKRKQPQSFDDKANGNASGSQEETIIPDIKKDDHNNKKVMKDTGVTTKSRLIRSGTFDILAQSSTETLLEMLKAHAGIKECSDETLQHVNGVRISFGIFICNYLQKTLISISDSSGTLFESQRS